MKKSPFIIIFIIPGIIALLIGLIKGTREGAPEILNATATKTVELTDGAIYPLVVSEVTKEINGFPQKMLAYNGSVPGPTIKVKQGSTITLQFINHSNMKTLLHSHGVRLENAYDGTHLVQEMVEPGATFNYKIHFTDPGIFIYHPHVREDLQQDLGLYGSYVVEPTDTNYWPPSQAEKLITLDDILIEDNDIAPHDSAFATHALMGRFGNTMLINGETNEKLTASAGQVIRYYFTNVANVRPFAITIPGAQMKLVGGDNGRYEKETFITRIVLAPSERAVVDVRYPKAGEYKIMHDPGESQPTYTLAVVTVDQKPVPLLSTAYETLRENDAYAASLAQYRSYLDKAPDKTLAMTLNVDMNQIMGYMGMGGSMQMSTGTNSMTGMSGMSGMHMHAPVPIEWEDTMGTMNVFSTDQTTHWILRDITSTATPPLDNGDVHWTFKKGDVVKLRIFNDPKSMHPMQHPFHIHGQRFLVLAQDGVPNDNLVWKDTVLVKMGETVDILIPMEDVGKWMMHCHIAEHLTSGMMTLFDVVE